MKNKTIEWEVEGMSCANCAKGVSRYLEQQGLEAVNVNFSTKEVRFKSTEAAPDLDSIMDGIQKMGYRIANSNQTAPWWTLERKMILAAIFTAPLLIQHLLMLFGQPIPALERSWVQLALALPVYIIGFLHFGRSAWISLKSGVPNMDVLIFTGSSAAFIYSVLGIILQEPTYLFFETSSMIITLVLLGNWMEERAVYQTTSAIQELIRLEAETAQKIMPSGALKRITQQEIKVGDLLQVNEGDKIPTDGRLVEGVVEVDESMVTGESLPVAKGKGDALIGGAIIQSGNMSMRVTATGKDTLLGKMIALVKSAQEDQPKIQRTADRVSAIFVPAVIVIAGLTFAIGYGVFDLSFKQAMMNSIAVLVISCPCAMGLATPTAVMVGVGRLARQGILIKGGKTLELLAQIRQFVFDKTGTLTTGQFRLLNIKVYQGQKAEVETIIYALEQHSSHPIAQSLVAALHDQVGGRAFPLVEVKEEKGKGMKGMDQAGNVFQFGNGNWLPQSKKNGDAQLVLTKNDELIATVELSDEIKPGAKETLEYLNKQAYSAVLLSGDKTEKVQSTAQALNIDTFFGEQLPEEKLAKIATLSAAEPTAMVGDGINDAPALAKATVGISLSNATQAAVESAQVVLLNGNLELLPKAIATSKATLTTIKQNLFWAFIYNVIAIPIAAVGLLNPMWGALFMAISDVIVIGNSIRLKYKRID